MYSCSGSIKYKLQQFVQVLNARLCIGNTTTATTTATAMTNKQNSLLVSQLNSTHTRTHHVSTYTLICTQNKNKLKTSATAATKQQYSQNFSSTDKYYLISLGDNL